MEVLLQYLDDLDDLYGMLGLAGERLRSVVWLTLAVAAIGVSSFLAAALLIAA